MHRRKKNEPVPACVPTRPLRHFYPAVFFLEMPSLLLGFLTRHIGKQVAQQMEAELWPGLNSVRPSPQSSGRLKKGFESDTEFQVVLKAVQQGQLVD